MTDLCLKYKLSSKRKEYRLNKMKVEFNLRVKMRDNRI